MKATSIMLAITGLLAASADAGEVPEYFVEAVLPVSNCTSVDLALDESRLYVRADPPGEGALHIFDTSDYALLRICDDIPSTPWKYRVTPDGAYVWTTRYYGGRVSKVDLETCDIVRTLDVGSWTVDLLFDAPRRYLFVGENHPGGESGVAGSVQVVDTAIDDHVAGIPLHGQPGQLAMAPMDRYLYVVSANHGTDTERLYKIDTNDWSVAGILDLPELPLNVGLSVHPDFRTVFVPRTAGDEVLVIDAASLTIVDRIGGVERAHHIVLAPGADHALILHRGLPKISVLDLRTREIGHVVDLETASSNWKREVAWSADGRRAFVAHGEVVVLGCCPCRSDLNDDGVVNATDLLVLLAVWGPCDGGCFGADIDEDGSVGMHDLVLLLAAWGPCE